MATQEKTSPRFSSLNGETYPQVYRGNPATLPPGQGAPPTVMQPHPKVLTSPVQGSDTAVVQMQGEDSTPPGTAWGLVLSILSILCCWPLATPAVVYNRKATVYNEVGQYRKARQQLKRMCIFLVLALVAGILFWVIAVLEYKSLRS